MPAMTLLSQCKNNAGKKKLELNITLDTVINDKEYMHFKVKPDFELKHRVYVFLFVFSRQPYVQQNQCYIFLNSGLMRVSVEIKTQ